MRRVSLLLIIVAAAVRGATGCTGSEAWNDHRPVLSPDGRMLAFMSDRSGTWAVYTMPFDRSSPPQRVSHDANGEWYPDWSPDGASLVYHRIDPATSVASLFRYDLATRREQPLGSRDTGRSGARWVSPDSILYVCRGAGICSMSANGEDRGVAFGLAGGGHDPALSPDGRWIAWIDPLDDDSQDAFVASVDRTLQQRITTDPGRTYGLDWSPDGRFLCYNTEYDGNAEIFVHDVQTGERRRITTDSSEDHLPRWSPDGRFILFTSDRSGHERIYRVARDGSDLQLVATDGG
jgi:TolB protein